ncbi:hypothetical protein BGX33_002022, partial [Mortierella sp. NVP41]
MDGCMLLTLEPLLRIYEHADAGLRRDIVRHFGKYLICYPNHEDLSLNVLIYFSNLWTAELHHPYCEFLTDLLSLATIRWKPQYHQDDTINPLAILLNKADKQSLANVPVKIIIDYCLRQARIEKDPHVLLSIRRCLHRLVDSKQSYSELARHVYRDMAFFPGQGREYIIGHHALTNPMMVRWQFWKPFPEGLHQYKDQVLQLDTVKIPNPPKGNFTRDFYLATFDMLWRNPQSQSEKSKVNYRVLYDPAPARILLSWSKTLWTMVLRKFRLSYSPMVECYPFELQILDNPALKALVEYKWNTIGFYYWLVRFLSQCCYYILVLTAVFLQIYGGDNLNDENDKAKEDEKKRLGRSLEGPFIAIITIASIFLWLELVQLFKDKQDYLRSIYNMVDLMAFFLPLAGGIIQICTIHGAIESGLNPGLLSFSVLFIFLHF